MSKPLVPLTVEAPGFLGLNSQNSGSVLPPGWASKLENFVWDDVGRLASRKGSQQLNATVITNTPTIRQTFEYVDATGAVLNIVAADNKLYKEVGGTMTDISGAITTPTGDDWQFANFNGWCVGYQVGHIPVLLDTVAGTFVDADDFGGVGTKTMHNGTAVLSAYGRVWTILGNTLYHTDSLVHNYAGGTSGSFNLAAYWPQGMDTAVAMVDFNGYLVVFGQKGMIVYQNPDDISVMSIVEGVEGLGCIARDSIQMVGKEVVFLSNSGLRTLSRTIQEKSMPITDISKNVRDDLVTLVASETKIQIKSIYNSKEGFYLLSLPTSGVSFLFDLKFPNEDGSMKAAKWDIAPTAMHYSLNNIMYTALTAGFVGTYAGFNDEKTSAGAGGTSYNVDFEGTWDDFSTATEGVGPLLKIMKRVSVLAAGLPSGAVNFKWAVDYGSTFKTIAMSFAAQNPARFGVALFNDTLYRFSAFGEFETVKSSISRSGQVIKIGLVATIDGSSFAVQRINLLAKLGKIGI